MDEMLWNATEDVLLELGVCSRNRAFLYCCESIQIMKNERGIKLSALYQMIANKYKVKSDNVRLSINYEVKNIENNAFLSVFGANDIKTNADFLGALLIKVKRKNFG